MKQINRRVIYNGKIINVYRDEVLLTGGNTTIREVVSHREAAAVVAVDQEGRIVLVEQHRYPIARNLLELPAGLMDEGETPLQAAQRELKEETGCEGSHWEKLITFYSSPGVHDEVIHLFFASGLRKVSEQSLDSDEEVTCHHIPMEEVLALVHAGEIQDGKTIVGLLLYTQRK